MNLRVAVLGGGSWGTTVATLASHNAPTVLWARRAETVTEVNEQHTNERYLPGARLPEDLRATGSLEEAVRDADVLVVGVPSHVFRQTLEQGSLMRMTEVIAEVLPGHRAGVLTGPNLAREIMAGFAAASVIGMEDESTARALQKVFHSGLFRVYTNSDAIGCEVGGALKNVIAIATGMGDGVGVGDNTRSMVITRGLAELSRLGVAMGGAAETFYGLAGMGDLIATCTSRQSRNRHVGEQLGKGRTLEEIVDEMHMVAEGVKTCRVVMELAERFSVPLPIAREVYGVVHEGRTPLQAYRGLVRHKPGTEGEPG
jgi:glycerol-3-phosphate dehydrogenase (NAD(P)+)